MKETYNWKSITTGLILFIAGSALVLLDFFVFQLAMNLGVSVGCSLIASALVILTQSVFLERVKKNPLDEWKIAKIYSTRTEKNDESDPELSKAKYCIDAVAFGLGSFRSKHTLKVEECLRKGVIFRIITMDPSSPYTGVRDGEENEKNGTTKYSIEKLIEWADRLNAKDFKGKIIIRGYSSMTLDFYWRVDDVIYVGPYWYGVKSQQTITYKFLDGGKGFTQYSEYFETLWNDKTLCKPLTQITDITYKKQKKS